MKELTFREIDGRSVNYWAFLGVLAAVILASLGAFAYIEHEGHSVTGMTEQFGWAGGHVVSIFMIASGAGVFAIASAASVFNRSIYKPLAPLAGLLAVCLLLGGLAVVALDLGRPDRLTLTMVNFNPKSVLASNIMRYQVFIGLVLLYLWVLMDWRYNRWIKPVAIITFLWSLSLSTGVGLEFSFLVAREAYDAAIMGPMMVASSFMYGTSVLLLVILIGYGLLGRPVGDTIVRRLKNLLALFVAAGFYFTFVHYLTMSYGTEHHGYVGFLMLHGGFVTTVFWIGLVLCGFVLPLILFYAPAFARSRPAVMTGAILVIVGGFSQMYVTLIGGQSYPLNLFPGFTAASSFADGAINVYSPTLPEFLLAIMSIPFAGILVSLGLKFFRFLPTSLEDEVVDPHHKPAVG